MFMNAFIAFVWWNNIISVYCVLGSRISRHNCLQSQTCFFSSFGYHWNCLWFSQSDGIIRMSDLERYHVTSRIKVAHLVLKLLLSLFIFCFQRRLWSYYRRCSPSVSAVKWIRLPLYMKPCSCSIWTTCSAFLCLKMHKIWTTSNAGICLTMHELNLDTMQCWHLSDEVWTL